jgi:DUF4097 and DUF4098 domain-containing protein YvlB
MKTQKRIAAALFTTTLALFFAQANVAQELHRKGGGYTAEIKKSYTAGAAGTLEMREISGDILVKAGTGATVEIVETVHMEVFTEAEAKRVLEACVESYSQTGNRITVEGRTRPRRSVESRFTVTVPASFMLDLGTSGGDLSIEGVKGNTTLRTSGGDIELLSTGGTVNAKTSGGDVVVRDAEGSVNVKTSGGDLELERIKGRLEATTSGGNITLRSADKEVTLRTSGGDIEIFEVAGNVVAGTSGGDVQVENTSGSVEVSTSGGDLVLRDIKGELEATTSGGDIRAERLHAASRLKTSGGDVIVRALLASLEAATSGGNIEVEMTLADFKKPHSMSLSSSGGDLELTIPEKLPAKIFAEIYLEGKWGWRERYDISSDFPLKIERGEGERRSAEYIRGEGEINGGGDLITLKTSAGNIAIRKGR